MAEKVFGYRRVPRVPRVPFHVVSMLRGCSSVHDRRLDNSEHARADVESRRALGKVG